MQIFYNNLVDGALITTSSTKTGYPAENLKSYHLSKKFSLDANSGTIVFDLGSDKLVNNLLFAGCNFTASPTILIEGNTSDEWTTPDYTSSATVYPNGVFGLSKVNKTLRYWRVSITDSVNPQIGYAYIGNPLQMPGISVECDLRYNTNSSLQFSVSGQTYSDTGDEYFTSSFFFPIITDYALTIHDKIVATRQDILDFWKINKGAKPIFLIIFEEDTGWIPPMVGIINQNSLILKYNATKGSYSLDFNFTETK